MSYYNSLLEATLSKQVKKQIHKMADTSTDIGDYSMVKNGIKAGTEWKKKHPIAGKAAEKFDLATATKRGKFVGDKAKAQLRAAGLGDDKEAKKGYNQTIGRIYGHLIKAGMPKEQAMRQAKAQAFAKDECANYLLSQYGEN